MPRPARYFDGRTSTAHEVEIALYGDGRLRVFGRGVDRESSVREIDISERIGDTPRRLRFSDGATCEIADNELIDGWLEHFGAHSHEHRVFRLERHWQYALAALLLTALGSYGFIRFGVPALADRAARVLPRSVDTMIGRGGLEALDHLLFEPSALPAGRQEEIRSRFDSMREQLDTGLELRLELRKGGGVGANAFALPSGIIVVTDELIELVEHDEELDSVLAHEVGHVVHRHSLRLILQGSTSALLMLTLLGDVSTASTFAVSVPTVLVQARYSRDLEREADAYAYAWLAAQGIPVQRFNDLLERLEEAHGGAPEGTVSSYFSSHPRTQERMR